MMELDHQMWAAERALRRFCTDLGIDAAIVGGFAVSHYFGQQARDADIAVFNQESAYSIILALAAANLNYDLYLSYEGGSMDTLWVIKTAYLGMGIDFVCWPGITDLQTCLASFDFDVNQMWIDNGEVQITAAAGAALLTCVATQSQKKITQARLQRMQEKFPTFEFVTKEVV